MPESDGRSRELPTVSVIIPVYNDADRLEHCLDALQTQTYPHHMLEVLVVDNGSHDDVENVVAGRDGVRLLHESRQGSYAARNRGIAEARGAVIAFTDADCVPSDTWLERGVNHLIGNPTIGLLGGRIEVQPADPSHPKAVELADMVFSFQQQRFIEQMRFAATASAFTRSEIFARVGVFDETLMSGGDRKWGVRVADAGFELMYAEDVVVTHLARSSVRELYRRSKRLHAGARDWRLSMGEGFPHRDFLRHLVPPIGTAQRLFGDARLPDLWSWAKLVGVVTLMRLFRAWFTLRFALGGPSPRQ